MKIAFVCDWLTGMRGGERCLEALCEIYPDADIFTLVHFPGLVSKTIESHRIHTSYIQKLPGRIENFRRYLPLFPHAMERFDLSGYDCILSFSHCVAKDVKPPPGAPHICYCYTPVRYAWHMRSAYLAGFRQPKRLLAECLMNYLRHCDRKVSSRVTHFIAISKHVQGRIKDAYDRDSIVIYPPVESRRFCLSENDDGYYLVLSALVPYKRVDLAVQAFANIERKLMVIGKGPELDLLKGIASANVSFVENADDNQVAEYMRNCTALLFPGEEDFGIVPLEAQACGKAVIAYAKGGALETVIDLQQARTDKTSPTGIFFHEQTPEALRECITLFEQNKNRFEPHKCRENALKFDRAGYKQLMKEYIESVIAKTDPSLSLRHLHSTTR